MKIHFRTDSPYYADLANLLSNGKLPPAFHAQPETLEEIKKTPKAQPGDTWRIRWRTGHESDTGPLAGYAICCPKCGDVHYWTSANNCHQGEVEGMCVHRRSTNGGQLGSCWQWSGSAEDGTLTASPSLHASGGCGWHGWLRNGELTEC